MRSNQAMNADPQIPFLTNQKSSTGSSYFSSVQSPIASVFGFGQNSRNTSFKSFQSSDNLLNQQKKQLQIFLDLDFKNYTRILVEEDKTAQEICKNLKDKYGQANTMQSVSFNDTQVRNSSLLSRSEQKGSQSSLKRNDSDQSSKDESFLFLINTKPTNPALSIRKLNTQDIVYKIYTKANDQKNQKNSKDIFKLIFAKHCDIEMYLKQQGVFQSQFDEENQVVCQLGKSIINNRTYERKGKLWKKSLNKDLFKERQFVLDKDQLFYYKNEKQKDKNFNLIMLNNAKVHILENYSKQKFCFQIENENRKYILSTKSQYDLDQWVFAIQSQIELSKENKNLADINASIVQKEQEISKFDMTLVQKIFRPKNTIYNPVQPLLLEFVKDPFINELLPNLTKYISLVKKKDYQRHALKRAKEIVKQLKDYQSKAQKSLSFYQKDQTRQQEQTSQQDPYKNYKNLKYEHKILCLFTEEELKIIDEEIQKYSEMLEDQKTQELQLNQKLFNPILIRIQKILEYNYLNEFYKAKNIELISIPLMLHKNILPPVEFNSSNSNYKTQRGNNYNLFESLLPKDQTSVNFEAESVGANITGNQYNQQ